MQRNKYGGGALLTVKRTVLERRDKGYRVKQSIHRHALSHL